MFFRAAAQVVADCGETVFVLAGRGTEGLESAVDKHGLSGRVRLLGERPDAPRLFNAFDVAVCSSYSEAFPNVVGEAMACGTPCVATDVGDTRTLLGDTGALVPARDAPALAEAIVGLLKMDGARREALGRNERQRIIQHYSIDSVAQRYQRLYLDLCAA
jgi:glycosyltransferase involved in cell wall biosynthesis